MISADFYPNDIALTNPTRQYSKIIDNLAISELSGAYHLGWIAWENFPQCWHFGDYAVTSSSFIFNDDTEPQNINIGYLSSYRVGGGGSMYAGAYTKNDNDVIARASFSNTAYEEGRYINKLDVMGVGIYQYYFWFNQHIRYGTHGVFSYFGQNLRVQKTWDISNYLAFINGESTTDITWSIPNVGNVTVTLNIADIQDDNVWHFSGTQNGYDYEMDVYIAGFSAAQTADTTPTGTNGGGPSMIKSCYTITDNDNVYLMHLAADNPMELFNRNYILINNGAINDSGSTIFNGRTFGGYIGNYPKSFVASNQTYNYMFDGNTCLAKAASTNSAYIFRVLSISEITTVISLQCRSLVGSQTKYGYAENDVYATYVTEDNEFTATLITGDLSDDEFKAKLRPWQYDVDEWAENDYTEEDLPPYEGGGGDEDEESGDRIPNQFRYFSGATNFITQYALTRTQVGQFGTKLWTSWADSLGDPTDMWKNFKIFIGGGDTGSIDIGTVLSFIVSLRVFPFDLSAYLGQSEPSIKIGTGNYPIEVANVWKLLSTVTYIDCGTVNVPRKFNDFRDYTNVTVSCYFPYCGTVQLNAGDVVGKTLHAWYAVDLQSGECLAVLESYDDTGMLYNVASISGSMGALIPITATNSGQIMAQRISDAANVAGFFVGNVTRGADVANRLGSKRGQSAMLGAIGEAISGQIDDIGKLANQGMSMLSRSAIECPSMSGGSGLAAFMTPDSPYIQIRYGIYSEPANYSHSVGRISTSSGTIGSYKGSGFITCENVDTTKLTCHNDEKAAIAAALETGVFV